MDTLYLSGIKLDPATVERIGRTLIRLALCVGHPEAPADRIMTLEQVLEEDAS